MNAKPVLSPKESQNALLRLTSDPDCSKISFHQEFQMATLFLLDGSVSINRSLALQMSGSFASRHFRSSVGCTAAHSSGGQLSSSATGTTSQDSVVTLCDSVHLWSFDFRLSNSRNRTSSWKPETAQHDERKITMSRAAGIESKAHRTSCVSSFV